MSSFMKPGPDGIHPDQRCFSYILIFSQHAHLSTTEVIGLLGGTFDSDGRVLDVRLARPCRSLSTGMQCEMDPGRRMY